MSEIVRVEVGRYDYDFVGYFKFFKADPDGKTRRPTVLIRLTDADGVQGWGQAVPVPSWTYETVESVETTLRLYLAEALLGADPADMADVHARMEYVIRPAFTVGQPLAKAAVDFACYDLVGKQRGQRVVDLLGGAQRASLTLNWTVNTVDLDDAQRQLAEGWERGYRHYTIKIGPPQTPAYDLELVRMVKDFAPDSFIWADANTGYDLETALEVAPRLADRGLQALESPLPPNRIRAYQALKRQGALPIYMDEGILSPVEVEEFSALGMIHGVTMKPARCAGIWPATQIISLLRERGLLILGSGLTDPDLSLAAALHVYAWAGMERPCALNGPQFLDGTLAENDWLPDQGIARLPDGPGLGLDVGPRAEAVLSPAAALS